MRTSRFTVIFLSSFYKSSPIPVQHTGHRWAGRAVFLLPGTSSRATAHNRQRPPERPQAYPRTSRPNRSRRCDLGIEIITEKEFIKRIGSYFVIEDDRLKRYIGCETQVSIPSGITTLEDRAFEDCKDLTDVIVPEGVTMLGCEVFRDCCNLTNIMLPEGLVSISGNAFECCSSLQNIRIPASVKIIGGGAFVGCRNLTDITILNRTTRIGCSAFWNCNRLTIHAPAGSYAERYAKENHIPFVAE